MSRKNGSTLIRILKILVVVLCGFAGGSLSPWILGWIQSVPVATPANAYAIANTYIVFTTIIFVSITLLLAIAGYVVTQQFSAARVAHEMQIIDELREQLTTDNQLGMSLVTEMLGERLAASKSAQAKAQDESAVLEKLNKSLFGKGESQ